VLNVVHGLSHLVQFVQSMLLVTYSTHEHCQSDDWLGEVMHHPIFALIMGAIGILTLVIGIKDYIHHKKCEADGIPHKH
jgi:hypothetical protein